MGESCSAAAPCAQGLRCVENPQRAAYCAPACTAVDAECEDAPGRTFAVCLDAGAGPACHFVCKVQHTGHAHSYPCPSGLTCGSTETSAGSGVYTCG